MRGVFATGYQVRMQGPIELGPHSEPEPDVAIIRGSDADYRERIPTAADVALLVDGKKVGKGSLPVTIPLQLGLAAGVAVGADPGAPVMLDYTSPFTFTGTVKKALIDITGEAPDDFEERIKMYLARQ